MTDHKFRAGQTVTVVSRAHDAHPPKGTFKIVRLLPSEHGTNQYRIKSTVDGHERVLMEHELA